MNDQHGFEQIKAQYEKAKEILKDVVINDWQRGGDIPPKWYLKTALDEIVCTVDPWLAGCTEPHSPKAIGILARIRVTDSTYSVKKTVLIRLVEESDEEFLKRAKKVGKDLLNEAAEEAKYCKPYPRTLRYSWVVSEKEIQGEKT